MAVQTIKYNGSFAVPSSRALAQHEHTFFDHIFPFFIFRSLFSVAASLAAPRRASGENRFVNCGKVSVERVEAPKLPIHGNSFRAEKHTVLFPLFPFDGFHFHEVWPTSRYTSIRRLAASGAIFSDGFSLVLQLTSLFFFRWLAFFCMHTLGDRISITHLQMKEMKTLISRFISLAVECI